MTLREHLLHAKNVSLGASPPNSQLAHVVAELGVVGYRLGLVLAAFSLLVASGFAVLTAEPIWHRLMTVVFLGIFPSLVAYASGWMLYWVLTIASGICDPVATLLLWIFSILLENVIKVWIFFIWFAKDVIPPCIGAIETFLRASHCRLERVIAAAALYSGRTMRGLIVAYRHSFRAVAFPVRLVARILMMITPQEA